ncbi:MAG: hypothetical protein H6566_11115 [Lewinellaceae bacterium]|nr:hypothetical protein [Lewinellaceae bacterium]
MSKIKKDTYTSADKAKEKYRVLNWSDYNKALVNRGSITIYFSDEAIEGWHDDGPVQRGGQQHWQLGHIPNCMLNRPS